MFTSFTGSFRAGHRQPIIARIVTQNLAIWIDANNPASYPGTGTSVFDLSGNGRTQNLSSAGIYTTVNGIKCFDCTTTGQITANAIGPVLPTTGFTYIAWTKMNSSNATFRTLFRTNPNDHPLLTNINTDNLGMWDNNGLNFVTANYTVSDLANEWAQWAVVGDSSGQQFYINGMLVGSTTASAAGNSHWYIGSVSNGQPFGYIANTFLYTTKLSQEQIRQNYRALLPTFEPLYTWYEAFGTTEAISTTQYVYGTKIYAYSSTYDVPSYQNAVIRVNDVEIVNTAQRGHTMAVLASDGSTISITNYDTYGSAAAVTALATALNAVAIGNKVVLVTYDASALDTTARSTINTEYGSTNSDTWVSQRTSHILVGIKS